MSYPPTNQMVARVPEDPASRIPVLVLDDHESYRGDLEAVLNASRRFRCSNALAGPAGMWDVLASEVPRIALVDMQIDGVRDAGIRVVQSLVERHPGIVVVVLTCHDDDDLFFRAICAGAAGYLIKASTSSEDLFPLLDRLMAGDWCLTPGMARKALQAIRRWQVDARRLAALDEPEFELLRALASGEKHDAIARSLGVCPRTVGYRISGICDKLKVGTAAEALVVYGRGTAGGGR